MTHPFAASFPSLSHFPTALPEFPRITSHINHYLTFSSLPQGLLPVVPKPKHPITLVLRMCEQKDLLAWSSFLRLCGFEYLSVVYAVHQLRQLHFSLRFSLFRNSRAKTWTQSLNLSTKAAWGAGVQLEDIFPKLSKILGDPRIPYFAVFISI